MKICVSSLIVFSVTLFSISAEAGAERQRPAENPVPSAFVVITPDENTEVVGKRPEIKVEFSGPIAPGSLVVVLDGVDVTQILIYTEKGFAYAPPMVLPAGMHRVDITAADKQGNTLEKSLSFSSRHTADFEEAYSVNEASIIYEKTVDKPDPAGNVPSWRVAGNLGSEAKVRGKEWELGFNTNLRALDQNTPVLFPQKEGIDAANWLLAGSYAGQSLRMKVNLGDVLINETPYTVFNLARRGGLFNLSYDNYRVGMFSVKSVQDFEYNGVGIKGISDDHIIGMTAAATSSGGNLEVKTMYVAGAEPGSSFGIFTEPGPRKGSVFGFGLISDFFENRFRTELEADFSRFDPDTTDEFEAKGDRAYNIKAGGVLDKYFYEAGYQYLGRDYAVVGNQMLQKDKEGGRLTGGVNLGVHIVTLQASRFHDNVRDDDLFPRIINNQGGIDYACNIVQSLPLGINYQRSVQESAREPEGAFPFELQTDTYTGRANYITGKLNIGFQTAYSVMDDKSEMDNDSTAITWLFAPAYNAVNATIASGFSLNRTKNRTTNEQTDVYIINPNVRTRFFREKATFDLGGAYNAVKLDDGSIGGRTLNLNFRLGYDLPSLKSGLLRPVIALRGSHVKVVDAALQDLNKDVFTLFLVLTAILPFSF